MNIIVCVKSVPDTDSHIRIRGGDIESSTISYIPSPYDEFAVEEAVKLVEKYGGSVTTLCLGTTSADQVIRKTIASGADNGVHLLCERELRDPFQVALALAVEIKYRDYDLLIFGRESADNNNSMVGPLVASMLNRPCLTNVISLEIVNKNILVRRQNGGRVDVVETPLPCVLTAQKGLNEPRFCSLKNIMNAKEADIEIEKPFIYNSFSEWTHLRMPEERSPGKILGEGVEAVPMLVKVLRGEVGIL